MDTNTDPVRAHDELRVQAALLRTPEFMAQFDPDKFAGQLERIAAALAQQPAAPSGAVNVVGMPEFDGMLDHIYEYGTAAEGVIERANAFARAVLARYAPHQPAGVMPDGISDDVIKAVWRAAMTSAHNVCVNRSNRWNDDDGPDDRITEANECAKEIAHWLEADEGFIAEIRAMLAAQQQGGAE